MKNLLRLQVISFGSRIIAMFSGIFQSLIIVNLLSVKEFGLIGLVTSIAGIAGITQHLGLASSSTKEISSAKSSKDIIHIVLASLSIRFLITFPIALFLFFFASQIAAYYQNSDLIFPLKIFAAVTIIQAFQSIFNSVISGTHRFKELFTYQVLISFVSVLIYVPLIYKFKLDGFFYSLVIFNLVQTVVLGYLAFKDIGLSFEFPPKSEFFSLAKNLLKVSLAIYFVKILFTAWQEIPVAVLGKQYSLELLALFTFAFNFSSKLMSISDSVTDVNLPVYSKKFEDKDFFEHFSQNFNVLFHFIFFVGISASYWAKEILQAADLLIFKVGSLLSLNLTKNIFERYQESLILFLPLILSIVFYSYLNILKSSVFVPLEKLRKMMTSYLLLIIGSFVTYLICINLLPGLISMSLALAVGAFVAFIYSSYFIYRTYGTNIFDFNKIYFSILSILVGYSSVYFSDMGLIEKSLIYLTYFICLTFIFKVNVIKLLLKRK